MSLTERFYAIKIANEFKKLFKTLLSAADEQGWRVKALDSGHYQFMPPEKDKGLVTISGTPSDHRAWSNIKSDLLKRGFEWPWSNGGEQPPAQVTEPQEEVKIEKDFNVPDYGVQQELDRAKRDMQDINKFVNTEDMSNQENVDLLNEALEQD